MRKACGSSRVGRVFLPPNGSEIRRLTLLLCGAAGAWTDWRGGQNRTLDLFDLKGALAAAGLGEVTLRRLERAEFALATEIFFVDEKHGLGGQLVSAQSSASAPVFVAEIDLPNDFESTAGARQFRELQRFPSIGRDIALIAPETLSHDEILAAIKSANEPLLATVELFDLFSGKGARSENGRASSVIPR